MVHIMLNPLFTCYNPSQTEITPQPATWKYDSGLVKERKTARKNKKVWDKGARHLHNPEWLSRQNNRSESKPVNRNVAGVACCMVSDGLPSLFPDLYSGVYRAECILCAHQQQQKASCRTSTTPTSLFAAENGCNTSALTSRAHALRRTGRMFCKHPEYILITERFLVARGERGPACPE